VRGRQSKREPLPRAIALHVFLGLVICVKISLSSGFGAILTQRYCRRRLYSRLMIWVAAVIQLHLLLVQDLHRHGAEGPAADARQVSAVTVNGRSQVQVAPSQGSPLCAACQITRQGSVQLVLSSLTPFQSVEIGDVAPLPLFAFRPVFRCPLTGRAPPLFS